jgi:hypothetical protein
MFQTIAEIAGAGPDRPRGGSRRTGEPVRRHSRAAGGKVFWRSVSRQEACQIVLAARRYELAGRQFGQRSGPLGAWRSKSSISSPTW